MCILSACQRSGLVFKLIVTTMLTVLVGLTSLSAQALNDPTKPSYYQGGTAKKKQPAIKQCALE